MCATKILAVDDEVDFELLITQRFRRQIREREFDFRFARHGQEALAAEPDIDLMLLDINMPVMDGLTLLAELRLRQSPVRAIIVSAYGDMANIRTAMNRALFQAELGPMLRGAAMGIADKFHPLLIEQLEAVHRRSAVAEMRNKTDLADARGIAHILRTGRFRHVHVELSAAPPAHLTTQPQTQVPRSGERSSALDQDVRAQGRQREPRAIRGPGTQAGGGRSADCQPHRVMLRSTRGVVGRSICNCIGPSRYSPGARRAVSVLHGHPPRRADQRIGVQDTGR
jgi:CheY-like chemotaxis protein